MVSFLEENSTLEKKQKKTASESTINTSNNKKEKKHNKREDPTPLKEHVDWTRLEIVFKKQRAQLLSRYILETNDIGHLLKGTLKNYIRFLQKPKKSKDMRKRRWKTAPWYEKLLGDVRSEEH